MQRDARGGGGGGEAKRERSKAARGATAGPKRRAPSQIVNGVCSRKMAMISNFVSFTLK